MHVFVVRGGARYVLIAARKVVSVEVTVVCAENFLSVEIQKTARNILPKVVAEENIQVRGVSRGIRWKKRVKVPVVVKWMRVKCGHVINPNALRAQQTADFVDKRAATA